MINPTASCNSKRYFSTVQHLKTWLRLAMGLLNVHKKLIGKPHLAEVGNEFVSLNQERFQYFSKFAVYSQHGS